MQRIRELRQEKGLSQVKFAVMANMDPATLNRLEQGKGNPNLRTLERVADALGVEVADLLGKVRAPSSQEKLFNNGVLKEEWRYSETGLATESWSYQGLDYTVRTIRDLIAEYEPIIGGLPEKPSAEEYALLKERLVSFLKQAASINKALWESGMVAASNELWAAVRAGEPVPHDLEQKVREFHGVVGELNSKLPLPAREWLQRLPETAELHSELDERVERWAQDFMEAERQVERVRKDETA
jgi:transcriptional regulator with XRE-family HTH domain